jgi:hypothetical protein
MCHWGQKHWDSRLLPSTCHHSELLRLAALPDTLLPLCASLRLVLTFTTACISIRALQWQTIQLILQHATSGAQG